MATRRQISANQRNSQLSTGPKTSEGKATSSKNALTHGLTAQHVMLPCEDASLYELLLTGLCQEYEPEGIFETQLVENIATGLIRLRRIPALEVGLFQCLARESQLVKNPAQALFAALKVKQGGLPITPAIEMGRIVKFLLDKDLLGKLGRYETTIYNNLFRAYKALEDSIARRRTKDRSTS